MAHLVSEKELKVIQIGGIVWIFDGSKFLVGLPVIGVPAVHPGKKHLTALHLQFGFPVGHLIFILFLVQDIDRFFIFNVLHLGIVEVTPHQGPVTILLPVEV